MKESLGVRGQVVAEYMIIFALVSFLVWFGTTFFDEVMERMRDTRDVGVDVIMNR